jgi:hypothetical protein
MLTGQDAKIWLYDMVDASWAVVSHGDKPIGKWKSKSHGDKPIRKWKSKIRHLRRFLRGWTKNTSGKYKKELLQAIIDELDIKGELVSLFEGFV